MHSVKDKGGIWILRSFYGDVPNCAAIVRGLMPPQACCVHYRPCAGSEKTATRVRR